MHQSFAYALVKWFFDNSPVFADSFSVASIHQRFFSIRCVARGLGVSFMYSCSASRDNFLRQHGLLVSTLFVGWRRARTGGPILTINTSYDVFPRKGVPLEGRDENAPHLWGQMPQKPNFLGRK